MLAGLAFRVMPRSAFQGFCGGHQRGSAAVCDPNPPRPFPRGPCDRKISIPIENFNPGSKFSIPIENFNLDRKFQSPSFHLRGSRGVQRRARSKISIHDRSLEIFNPEGRDRIFSIPGPSGLLSPDSGPGLRSVQKVSRECPRSVRKVFRTLRGHSRDSFWTLRRPGPEAPQKHPKDTPGTLRARRARETPVAGRGVCNLFWLFKLFKLFFFLVAWAPQILASPNPLNLEGAI